MSIAPERLAEIRERDQQQTIFCAVLDRSELLAEVTELSDALKENQNKADKFWRWLREARRENADLRAKGAHLAENHGWRVGKDDVPDFCPDHDPWMGVS